MSFYHFTNRAAGRFCCFCGGYIDSVGYYQLHGLFTASITGNIVRYSEAATHNQFSQASALVTICFGLGSITVRVFAQYLSHMLVHTDLIGMYVFILEVLMLIITIGVGTYYERAISEDQSFQGILMTGMIMAYPMGIQYAIAAAAFKEFPNTVGMTASVGSSFSAIGNVVLLYLSEWGVINFYLTKEEMSNVNSIIAKKTLYEFKKGCAFDELDRQLNPLIYFTIGCIAGISATERFRFHSLWIPVGIILFLIFEIYLARSFHVESPCNSHSIEDNDIEGENQSNNILDEIQTSQQDLEFSRSLVLQSFDRRMDVQTTYDNLPIRRTSISGTPFSSASKSSSPRRRLVHSKFNRYLATFQIT